jgi:hypothetical protein
MTAQAAVYRSESRSTVRSKNRCSWLKDTAPWCCRLSCRKTLDWNQGFELHVCIERERPQVVQAPSRAQATADLGKSTGSAGMGDPSVSEREVLVDGTDRSRSFADGGRDSLDRACPNVACGE